MNLCCVFDVTNMHLGEPREINWFSFAEVNAVNSWFKTFFYQTLQLEMKFAICDDTRKDIVSDEAEVGKLEIHRWISENTRKHVFEF